MEQKSGQYILAFDSANEVIAIGLGRLHIESRQIEVVADARIEANRQSNTQLLVQIGKLLDGAGVAKEEIAAVAVGRGPGSFTGVRIAVATAKGIASGLGVGLIGLSTPCAVAWNAWDRGIRGRLLVVLDAMRKEVYPARFKLGDEGVLREDGDSVANAQAFAQECGKFDHISGDALKKYRDLFEGKGPIVQEGLWSATGTGLLSELQDEWARGSVDPLDKKANDPAILLPVYTRLSDAEENERKRNAGQTAQKRDLLSGVQGLAKTIACDPDEVSYVPSRFEHAPRIAALEGGLMRSDAWSEPMVCKDMESKGRIWWSAVTCEGVIGYAAALVTADEMELLKIGVDPRFQGQGIGGSLLRHAAYDAQNLGAVSAVLEVRASNARAISFYESNGFSLKGKRARYYSDGEDAYIYGVPIRNMLKDERHGVVAGIEVEIDEVSQRDALHNGSDPATDGLDAGEQAVSKQAPKAPLILAIETSCDETAAAIIDGDASILSDVVASQIDFHARFGGVVPEIASRKHIEAICGVADIALERAFGATDVPDGTHDYSMLDAVAATYTPGLVGALVVGVAFAKGLAWALDVPYIGVNHLEGHLYANRLATRDAEIELPAVVSLVSGGNTMLVLMRAWGSYEVLGSTIDDAVGEAFDKIAKALGLSYPGGPAISRLAQKGRGDAIDFPRAMMHSGDLNFSLSGLKTAVITYIEKEGGNGAIDGQRLADICASFEQAVIDVQVAKARSAIVDSGAKTFCIGGGVAANPELRHAYETLCASLGVALVMPPMSVCGDNASMIALVALDRYMQGRFFGFDADAYAHSNLEEPY